MGDREGQQLDCKCLKKIFKIVYRCYGLVDWVDIGKNYIFSETIYDVLEFLIVLLFCEHSHVPPSTAKLFDFTFLLSLKLRYSPVPV